MFLSKLLSLLALLTMAGAIMSGFLSGSFLDEGSAIWALAWGKVTLIDLYVGLVFFGGWVSVRERRPSVVILWWAGLVVLGNLAAALYLVFASFTASSVGELLTGKPAPLATAVIPLGETGS